MDKFPLFDLNPNHLESVINKVFLHSIFCTRSAFQLEDKSYFKLQQTCRDVGDFIRSSSNISVHLHGPYYLNWDDKTSSYIFDAYHCQSTFDVDAFYATRLSYLAFSV